MLLLFETAAGFALFKVNKEDKLEQTNVREVSRACSHRTAAGRGTAAAAAYWVLISAMGFLLQDFAKDFETVDSAKKVCWCLFALLLWVHKSRSMVMGMAAAAGWGC